MEGHQAVRVPVPVEERLIGKSVSGISETGGVVRQTDRKTVLEKPRSEVRKVTVPKLTQVGEANILRRSREPSLRNSAK